MNTVIKMLCNFPEFSSISYCCWLNPFAAAAVDVVVAGDDSEFVVA